MWVNAVQDPKRVVRAIRRIPHGRPGTKIAEYHSAGYWAIHRSSLKGALRVGSGSRDNSDNNAASYQDLPELRKASLRWNSLLLQSDAMLRREGRRVCDNGVLGCRRSAALPAKTMLQVRGFSSWARM